MRISAFSMPLFALFAGAAGYYIRLMELWNVFDDRTGLPQRGAGITLVLIILSVVYLLIVFIFALRVRLKHVTPRGFENAYGTESLAYPFIFLLIGLAWLGATAKHLIDLKALGTIPLSEVYFSVLSALSAIATALFAIEMYQDPRRKSRFALSVVPAAFTCFWLVLLYMRNSANPILLSYCYQCLAIIASTLGFYFTSGFIYNKPAPAKTIFAYFASIYFCFVTLADGHTFSIKIIFIALIIINVVYSSMLIRRIQGKI